MCTRVQGTAMKTVSTFGAWNGRVGSGRLFAPKRHLNKASMIGE
jgi:hypothetical protein